eukprot:12769223-Heterocapsa_arctica.AAC.1
MITVSGSTGLPHSTAPRVKPSAKDGGTYWSRPPTRITRPQGTRAPTASGARPGEQASRTMTASAAASWRTPSGGP